MKACLNEWPVWMATRTWYNRAYVSNPVTSIVVEYCLRSPNTIIGDSPEDMKKSMFHRLKTRATIRHTALFFQVPIRKPNRAVSSPINQEHNRVVENRYDRIDRNSPRIDYRPRAVIATL